MAHRVPRGDPPLRHDKRTAEPLNKPEGPAPQAHAEPPSITATNPRHVDPEAATKWLHRRRRCS